MFNKYIKLVLACALLALSGYLFADRQVGNGISTSVLALSVFFFYLRNELILLAFLKMRKEDLKGAKKWLDKIKHPKSALIRSQEAYYYFLKGVIESENSLTQSERLFRKALNTGLFMDHDKAMAKLNIAASAMTKGRKREAQQLLKEAQALDKKGMLTEQIKRVKEQMKRAHLGRNPNLMRLQRNRGKGF